MHIQRFAAVFRLVIAPPVSNGSLFGNVLRLLFARSVLRK